jgi:hypothetical protein
LREREAQPEVIPPASSIGRKQAVRKASLLPEGTAIVNREGCLRWDGHGWHMEWSSESVPPFTKLLPNSTLEQMVLVQENPAEPPFFLVTGELTVFRDENHLLAAVAMQVRKTLERPPTPSADSFVPPATDAPVDAVREHLKSQEPSRRLVPVDAPAASGAAPRISGAPARLPEGASVIRRAGRLAEAHGGWTFIFESDHPDRPEPPLRVLSNRNLELMMEAFERGRPGLVFIVSGEVTAFAGENYLLVRVATQRVDLGNLRN